MKLTCKQKGGKLIKGVCKLSYNPFKMWGSWVGLIYGITGSFIVFMGALGGYTCFDFPKGSHNLLFYPSYYISCLPFLKQSGFNGFIIFIIINIIIFFLIGWGIHSLVRRYRK